MISPEEKSVSDKIRGMAQKKGELSYTNESFAQRFSKCGAQRRYRWGGKGRGERDILFFLPLICSNAFLYRQ